MAKRSNEPSDSSISISRSTSTGTSSGWSESSSFSSGETHIASYDPAPISMARALLLWNLGDLRNNLQRAQDLNANDRDWYLARAGAIFENAFQKKERESKEDTNHVG